LFFEALLDDHEPIYQIKNTSIARDQVGSMAQIRVIELERVLLRYFFVNHADSQPIAGILVNLESHSTAA
jgi:hypothetical protein